MKTIFITGDRTMTLPYPGMVAIEMLRVLGRGDRVATGTNSGVEQCVRSLANSAGLEVDVIENPTTVLENGKPDWDERTQRVKDAGMTPLIVHLDPHDSRIVMSMMRVFGDDENAFTVVSTENMLA